MNSTVMDDCETPTLSQVIEFKYEGTPTVILEANRLQETQNLLINGINMRCFTPTTEDFQSPGLSPITEMAKNLINGVGIVKPDNDGFQKPLTPACHKKYCYNSSTNMQQQQSKKQTPQQRQQQPHRQTPQTRQTQARTQAAQQQPLQQAAQQLQKYSPDILVQQMETFSLQGPQSTSESPLLTTLNLTTADDMESSMEGISPEINSISANKSKSTISNISNLLDRTLNVVTLLRSVGLEQYEDLFNEKDLDLQEFLSIGYEDLQQIGVRTHEHRQIIMDLLSEFNGA